MTDETTTGTTTATTGAADTAKTETTTEAAKTDSTVLGTKTEGETKTEDAKTADTKTEGDKKAEGDKKTDAPSVDPKAFKLPDGFTADEKQMGDFAALANEFKLPQDAAQKLVDLHAAALKQASETSSKYWSDKQAEWLTEAKKTYGPEPAKNPKIVAVSKLIDSLGEKPAGALREALDMSGMGNHPAVVAAFAQLAERLSEPGHAKGSPAGRPANIAESFYGTSMQPKG